MKNFTSVNDVPDLRALIRETLELKHNPLKINSLGKNKTLGLFFFNPSLRTRLSTQKAAQNLGMNAIVMNAGQGWELEFESGVEMRADKPEHIKEAAAVMSRYFDIIGVRSFPSFQDRDRDYSDFVLSKFLEYATVPVLSLESAIRHPLQSLTDLATIEAHKKKTRPKIVLTWAPHPKVLPQAVANSFAEWIGAAGYDLTITHPEGFELAPEFAGNAKIEYDQNKAFENADFVYAKNWSAFNDYGKTTFRHDGWMVTPEKMARTNDAFFMHCLPVRRNVVVADAVLDSPRSLIIEQAGNRTFAAQAVLARLLKAMPG
ncbi:MAG: N-acetylornithine carbamoyltransferase [Bacteroidetes bacterium]|nr:MAG: N-acetylornithine carbamoyltransferase [Bacteroidota bacterium]